MKSAGDKFAATGLQLLKPALCDKCAHRSKVVGALCLDFPDGIPTDILSGVADHTKPYPGDHGIRFEEKKGA